MKLTDEIEKRICDAIRAGNYLVVAARYAGVSRSTLQRWLALGRRPDADPRLKRFVEMVEKAEADAEVNAVAVIRKSIGRGDAVAAFNYLERRHPERWRRGERRTFSVDTNDTASGELDASDPVTRKLLNDLLRRRQTDR